MDQKLKRMLQPNTELFLIIIVLFSLLALIVGQVWLAVLEAVVALTALTVHIAILGRRRKALAEFAQSVTGGESSPMWEDGPFPAVLFHPVTGQLYWYNHRFSEAAALAERMTQPLLDDLIPDFTTGWLAEGKSECPYAVQLGKHRYRVYGTLLPSQDGQEIMGCLYFADLTELFQVRDEYIRSRPVVGIILIDNYDDLTKNLTESAISTLNAKLGEVINTWAEEFHGMLRRLERNRFLLVFEARDLNLAAERKFLLLDRVHAVTSPSGLAATISMGLGKDGATFEESYGFAALSVEMALSRGGDQAVVKDRMNFTFYGGRTKEAETRSKVRSRVAASSLSELIDHSSHIFVMGHRNADLDAVGAAAGVCCLCRKLGKTAKIILDLEHNAAQGLVAQIREDPAYANTFISAQDALLLADNKSLLIVVDTNRPDQVESLPVLEAISHVCVIDHHLRAADYISPVVVNFHQPSASSASELVTELLQYTVEDRDVLPVEARALLAGLMLDTKSFNVRTNEGTFEAAAFLRRLGADTVDVKKLLQSDFQSTMAKYQIIRSAKLYRDSIAIAAMSAPCSRTIAAQAADELLGIQGILTSFVLFPQDDQVIISARSIGECNVQLVLEPLGGGGNAATAGCQVKNSEVQTVLQRLVNSINQYYQE